MTIKNNLLTTKMNLTSQARTLKLEDLEAMVRLCDTKRVLTSEPNTRLHAQRLYRDYADRIDPNSLPTALELAFEPKVVNAFIWGPRFEWTGIATPESLYNARRMPLAGEKGRRLNLEMYVVGEGPKPTPFDAWRPSINYSSLSNYANGRGGFEVDVLAKIANYRDFSAAWSTTNDATALELAALLQTVRFSETAIDEWIAALKAGEHKFGYGSLRDGEDRFSALGVLADINGCAWEWDENERAWGTAGECFLLDETHFREYVGIPEYVRSSKVKPFYELLTNVVDGATTHDTTISAITEAIRIVGQRRSAVEACQRQACVGIGDSGSEWTTRSSWSPDTALGWAHYGTAPIFRNSMIYGSGT